MAQVASGVTVTLPSGSVSEVSSISVRTQGMSIGYSTYYNPNAGSLSITSFDAPGATIGVRGPLSVSGSGINFAFSQAYVESVDVSATTGGVVTYSTTVKLIGVGA